MTEIADDPDRPVAARSAAGRLGVEDPGRSGATPAEAGGSTGDGEEARSVSATAVRAYLAFGAGTALRFIVQLVFARLLGQVDFGRFVLARTWGETVASFADRGHGAAMQRILPALEAKGEGGAYRQRVLRGSAAAVVGGVVLAAGGIAITQLWGDGDAVLVLGMVLIPLLALVRVLRLVQTAQGRLHTAMFVTDVAQPLLMMGLAGSAFLAVRGTAAWAMAALALSMALTLVIQIVMVARRLPPSGPFDPEVVRHRGMLGPMVVIHSTVTIFGAADVLIVGAVAGPAAAGTYAVGLRLAALSRNINNLVEQSSAPRIAAAWARGDRAGVQGIIDRAITTSLLPTAVASAGLVACGWWVLGWFGPSFTDAFVPLLILLAAQLTSAATGPSGNVLMMTDGHGTFATLQAVLLAIHLPLAWFLTDAFGLVGTATATFIITAATNVLLVVLTRRMRDLDVSPRWLHLRQGVELVSGLRLRLADALGRVRR